MFFVNSFDFNSIRQLCRDIAISLGVIPAILGLSLHFGAHPAFANQRVVMDNLSDVSDEPSLFTSTVFSCSTL
jgi:hypothetical protein